MADLVQIAIPRQLAQELLGVIRRETARQGVTERKREQLQRTAGAISEVLGSSPCSRCHGQHLVANPAWDRIEAEAESYGEHVTPAFRRFFAGIHGPEMSPCPDCRADRRAA